MSHSFAPAGPVLPGTAMGSGGSWVRMSEDVFGKIDNQEVRRFTLENSNQLSVQIITYGAIITSLRLPDKNGAIEDIVLGFDSLQGGSFFP